MPSLEDAVAKIVEQIQNMPIHLALTTFVHSLASGDEGAARRLIDRLSDKEVAYLELYYGKAYAFCREVLTEREKKTPPLRTPAQWLADEECVYVVIEPVGWHEPGSPYIPKRWNEPISKEEFLDRLGQSITAHKGTPGARRAYDPKHGGDEPA